MQINILFLVLTFVIVIAVIMLADNLTSAVLIISMIANYMAISTHLNKASKYIEITPQRALESMVSREPEVVDESTLYGDEHEMHTAYNDAYTSCYKEPEPVVIQSCSEKSSSIDAMNAHMAQRRARDKKVMDGVASKDKYYYAHHFAQELDEAEAKPWWGAADR